MSWDRNNLALHALPSVLCDSFSSSSAGLNLGRHLGRFRTFPMVAGNGPNTSLSLCKGFVMRCFFMGDQLEHYCFPFTHFVEAALESRQVLKWSLTLFIFPQC